MSDMHVCPGCGLEYAGDVLMKLRAERDALRELLKEAREWIDFGGHHTSEEECYVCKRLERIDAALAAKESER